MTNEKEGNRKTRSECICRMLEIGKDYQVPSVLELKTFELTMLPSSVRHFLGLINWSFI